MAQDTGNSPEDPKQNLPKGWFIRFFSNWIDQRRSAELRRKAERYQNQLLRDRDEVLQIFKQRHFGDEGLEALAEQVVPRVVENDLLPGGKAPTEYKEYWKRLTQEVQAAPDEDVPVLNAQIETWQAIASYTAEVRFPGLKDLTDDLNVEATVDRFERDVRPLLRDREKSLRKQNALTRDFAMYCEQLHGIKFSGEHKRELAKARKEARARLPRIVGAVHERRMADVREVFSRTKGREIVAQWYENEVLPSHIGDMFTSGGAVDFHEIPERYVNGPVHFQDQLINGVTCVIDRAAGLKFRQAEAAEGGLLHFQRGWFKLNPKSEVPVGKADEVPPAGPAWYHFVDRVSLSAFVDFRDRVTCKFSFSKTSRPKEALHKLIADLRGGTPDKHRTHPGVTDYGGFAKLEHWLLQDHTRRIAIALDPDGALAVAVYHDPTSTEPAQTVHQARNTARVMALLATATVYRAIQGVSGRRAFPETRKTVESADLHIPTTCVWPLEVCPTGIGSSVREESRAKTCLYLLSAGELKTEPQPEWVAGWLPLPETDTNAAAVLPARFNAMTERHLRALWSGRHRPENQIKEAWRLRNWITTRFGRNDPQLRKRGLVSSEAILRKVARSFTWSSIAVFAIWVLTVVSTLAKLRADTAVTAALKKTGLTWEMSVGELRFFTLTVFAICLWRLYVSYRLSQTLGVEHSRVRRESRSVDWAFRRPWSCWIGPVLLGLYVMIAGFDLAHGWATLVTNGIGLEWAKSVETIEDATYYQTLEDGVWTLPAIALGFLLQAYLMHKRLVAERSDTVRRLAILDEVGAVAGNTGTEGASAAQDALEKRLDAIRTELQATSARLSETYNKTSVGNAAIFSVLAIAQPFGDLVPVTSAMSDGQRLIAAWEIVKQADARACSDPETLIAAQSGLDGRTKDTVRQVILMHCIQNRQLAHDWARSGHTSLVAAEVTEAVTEEFEDLSIHVEKVVTAMQDVPEQVAKLISMFPCMDGNCENPRPFLDYTAKLAKIDDDLTNVAANVTRLLPEERHWLTEALGGLTSLVREVRLAVPVVRIGQISHTFDITNVAGPVLQPAFEWPDPEDFRIFRVKGPPPSSPHVLKDCEALAEFRFDTGVTDLARAYSSTSRTIDDTVWQKLTTESRPLVVVGSADGSGTSALNFHFAETRADAVAVRLAELRNVRPVTLSLGEAGWIFEGRHPPSETGDARRFARVYACGDATSEFASTELDQ